MAKDTMIVDDAVYETELTDTYKRSKEYKLADKNIVKAFIPGLISKILVKENDIVKAGTPLLILEAMKMLNEIDLNYDVKIVEIVVKEGAIVANRQLLMKVELI